MKRVLMSLALLLAALPASAQVVGQRAAAFLDVIIGNGCELTSAQGAEILPPLGFQRGESKRLSKELAAAGMISISDKTLRVADGLCPGAASAPLPLSGPQEQFVAILRHNGCLLRTGDAERLFPEYGMDMGRESELEEGLVDSGIAAVSDAALRIGPEYCIADEAFADLPDLVLSADEQHLIEILETGNCTLLQSEIAVSYPQDSLPPEAAQAAVDSLLASGAALAVAAGDRVWLSPAVCRPWSERKN